MTKKEIDIQTALGTLPLWKQIELGIIVPIETPSLLVPGKINLSYAYKPNVEYHYNPNKLGARDEAIQFFIADCILNKED